MITPPFYSDRNNAHIAYTPVPITRQQDVLHRRWSYRFALKPHSLAMERTLNDVLSTPHLIRQQMSLDSLNALLFDVEGAQL